MPSGKKIATLHQEQVQIHTPLSHFAGNRAETKQNTTKQNKTEQNEEHEAKQNEDKQNCDFDTNSFSQASYKHSKLLFLSFLSSHLHLYGQNLVLKLLGTCTNVSSKIDIGDMCINTELHFRLEAFTVQLPT
jgi:hypothetical protein